MQSAEQHSERMSGGLLGGYKEVSTSDSEVAEAASFAAEQLSQRSNSLYPFKVKEVGLGLRASLSLCPTQGSSDGLSCLADARLSSHLAAQAVRRCHRCRLIAALSIYGLSITP